MKFSGLLTLVDVPSDRPPAGGRGHCVILTREAAIAALHQLIGLKINCHPLWGTHLHPVHAQAQAFDDTEGFARIDTAEIVNHELLVSGIITDESVQLPAGLGMSYELLDCHVPDMRAHIWRLDKVSFSGAAVLRADKAAYKCTWFKVEDNLKPNFVKCQRCGHPYSDHFQCIDHCVRSDCRCEMFEPLAERKAGEGSSRKIIAALPAKDDPRYAPCLRMSLIIDRQLEASQDPLRQSIVNVLKYDGGDIEEYMFYLCAMIELLPKETKAHEI